MIRLGGRMRLALVLIGFVASSSLHAQSSSSSDPVSRAVAAQQNEYRRAKAEEQRQRAAAEAAAAEERQRSLEQWRKDEERRNRASEQQLLDKMRADMEKQDAAERADRLDRERARQLNDWSTRFAPVLGAARVSEYAPYLKELARIAGPDVAAGCPWVFYDLALCPRVLLLAGIAELDRVVDEQPGADLDKAVGLLLRIEDRWGYRNGRDVLKELSQLGWRDRVASDSLKHELYLLANDARPPRRSLSSFTSKPIDLAQRTAAIKRGVAARREQERVAAEAATAEARAAKLADDARRAAEQRERERRAAAENAAVIAARQRESAAAQHALATVRARWRAAGIGYDLWSALPRDQETQLVREALAAVPEYEYVLTVRRTSSQDELRSLDTIKAAVARPGCTPEAPVDCMPLVTAASHAKYTDWNTTTIVRNLATLECHAHRVPLACRLAGHYVDARDVPEAQWLVRQLAYWTMGCALPGELPGGWLSRCAFIADDILDGRYGRPDVALASDLYQLACVRDRREFCMEGPAKIRRVSVSKPER